MNAIWLIPLIGSAISCLASCLVYINCQAVFEPKKKLSVFKSIICFIIMESLILGLSYEIGAFSPDDIVGWIDRNQSMW